MIIYNNENILFSYNIMFECTVCPYKTNNKSNFRKHEKTKKHKRNIAIYMENNENTRECDVKKVICDYCKKGFHPRSISRHINTCKSRNMHSVLDCLNNQYEQELQKMNDELENIKMINKEYTKIIAEYNKKPNITISNTNNTVNINHTSNIGCILQQYNNVPNIEDVARVPLTDVEKDIIDKSGVVSGAIEFMIGRCIKDIHPDRRPFHCTDPARNMYITKHTNKWLKDPKGHIIEKHMKHPVIVYACESMLDISDVNKQCRLIGEISDIQDNFGRKVLNPNKGKVLSKNTITQ